MIIAISFALALFLSFVLVPLASRYANALGLMDAPDDRKVHSQAIPRAGGIAIVIAFFVPALYLFFTPIIFPKLIVIITRQTIISSLIG